MAREEPIPLPFNTVEVDWTELRKNDIVAVREGREISEAVLLYRVVRVNPKSFTVCLCDLTGREMGGTRKWATKDYPAWFDERLQCEVRKSMKFHKVM